jgi:hypothetical protein
MGQAIAGVLQTGRLEVTNSREKRVKAIEAMLG